MINQRTERSKTGTKISKSAGARRERGEQGRMKLDGQNFKIPSPPLASVSLGPFCAPPKASCPPLENLRAPLKFCPCAVCASCDRAILDGAKSLSMEFCSKFIAKFKIITSAVLATPCRLTMRVNLSARNIQSAQRNKEPMRKDGRRSDTTQRRERIGYFGYEGKERAAYHSLKI